MALSIQVKRPIALQILEMVVTDFQGMILKE